MKWKGKKNKIIFNLKQNNTSKPQNFKLRLY